MKGFNIHVGPGFTWDQSHFNDMAAIGARINRVDIEWDVFEPSQGVISSAAIANLDLHIARARSAGLYTVLDIHLNVGRCPSWTSAYPTEMEKYAAYGRTLTQYLAYRYGNPGSPFWTKAVVGLGLNEPPLEDSAIRNGNGAIPYLEAKQRLMISWMRAPGFAPDWIGFVAVGFASATVLHDDTWQNPAAADASPTAYDSVGGNVSHQRHRDDGDRGEAHSPAIWEVAHAWQDGESTTSGTHAGAWPQRVRYLAVSRRGRPSTASTGARSTLGA